MKIIGATITTGATIGLVFNLGGTMYMVTGRPWAIEALAGYIGQYSGALLTRPTPENDDVLGGDTLRIDGPAGWASISGPYNAIEALRDIVPARKAA